jgi:Domain of unknown function (DUF4349)
MAIVAAMSEDHPRATLAAIIGFVAVVLGLAFALMSGTQVSAILSKVGASINDQGASGGGFDSGPLDYPPPKAAATPGSDGQVAMAAVTQPSLLIVHTGTLSLEVPSVTDSVSRAATLVSDAGGFVAGSKESGTGAEAAAMVEYRIPAPEWERTLTALRGLATVKGQEIKADEVTGTVVDLGARISNLRATEAALQGIMARAAKISDVLDVQKQLTEVRGQIEELSAQKAELVDQAAYGSLTVTFALPPKPAATPTPRPSPPGWDPGRDVELATGRLVRIGQLTTTAGIWLVIVGVPLLVAATVALAIAWATYRLVARRRERASAPIA